MAEAYASLVSLMQTIEHIIEHGRNSFALNHQQIQSAQEKAAFLVEFLECYSHGNYKEVQGLESQIADAAHVAEDLIEFKVVDYIYQNQSTSFDRMKSNPFCDQLKDVIEAMELMKNKAVEIRGKGDLKVQLPKDSSLTSRSLAVGKDIMVGFDDVLIHIMDRLTRQQSRRHVIPISGMGGIGKTTLTRNVFENSYIVQHFDIRAWVTISQKYEIKEILSNLLIEFEVLTKEETAKEMNESELGVKIHKYLFRRKYLIVMDDMWSIDVWNKVQLFFPENGNGSRIMITTRLTNMASHLGSRGFEVDFLNEDQSWNLLSEKVFGQRECPVELEETGKKIAKNCKGLPLSIVVVAGLLAKSNLTREYWDSVVKQVNSVVTQADDQRCSKILSLSYVNLPVHLKPCFLYMGVFPEDHEIQVSQLIRLWVAEGFLKQNRAKSLEDMAYEYVLDLIDRNLIMIHTHGILGNVKYCKIHDLLRDLCIRESQKEKFLCVAKSLDSSQALHNQRRIVIDRIEKEQNDPMSLLRSIKCYSKMDISLFGGRLIRVLNGRSKKLFENVVLLFNLRYLNFWISRGALSRGDNVFRLSSTISLLWNIQSLILVRSMVRTTAPPEIWEMKQLRHLQFDSIYLPEPPRLNAELDEWHEEESNMKHHIHTLRTISNLTLTKGVVKRILNIKKLKLHYEKQINLDEDKHYCLSNLQHLHKLRSLCITMQISSNKTNLYGEMFFPQKLKLYGTYIPWEDMSIIGCLPNLEVLNLYACAFTGEEWNPTEGQFISLKYLTIKSCDDLKVWNAESNHFPILEKLFLCYLIRLKEIPLGIGEILTLRYIQVVHCCDSVVSSVVDILDEQELQGNDGIQVKVHDANETLSQEFEARDSLKFYFTPYAI